MLLEERLPRSSTTDTILSENQYDIEEIETPCEEKENKYETYETALEA